MANIIIPKEVQIKANQGANYRFNFFLILLLLCHAFISFPVSAKKLEFVVELKDHLFHPSTITIPANQKVKLVIYNHDNTPEEFDSFDLNREKVIFPNKKAVIFIGPLSPGRYEFFGEFNPHSAKGVVIVKLKPTKQVQSPVPNIEEDN